jgi:tetraacyldisaccharide 4'-kinase
MSNLLNTMFFFGRPFSPLYSALMRIRSRMYRNGLLKSVRLRVPVISIGNLTMGGTGKTPLVRYIAEILQKNGYVPAIISRGYGGKANCRINVVSDGTSLLLDARQAGDEPRLLAESLPGIPVVTGRLRMYPCLYAIENFGADILLLDDGFQHMAVVRDLDLVLFNASTPAADLRVFPGGLLREPLSALSRADAFILTGSKGLMTTDAGEIADFLRAHFSETPIIPSMYTPSSCRLHGTAFPWESLPVPLYGFCGIAEPSRFLHTLNSCDLQLNGFTALKDHEPYSIETITKITRSAQTSGAKGLITTEKDRVKLSSCSFPLPLFDLSMTVRMPDGFTDFLLRRISKT